MGKINLSQVAKSIQLATKKHSPEILTGIGIAGMITTTVMAVKATPKALDILAEIKEKHAEDNDKKEYSKDVVVKVCPVYVPSVIIGGLSIACLIGASSVNFRRNAALATAYSLSESALKEYQEKVIETVGEKKEQTIQDSIAKDRIDRDPVACKEIVFTGNGNTLCYEYLSGRYFRCDRDKIDKAVNELNYNMLRYDYVSLNDFYDEIGLDDNGIGYKLGWRIDKGKIELSYSSQLAKNGEPCLVIDYKSRPFYDYDM